MSGTRPGSDTDLHKEIMAYLEAQADVLVTGQRTMEEVKTDFKVIFDGNDRFPVETLWNNYQDDLKVFLGAVMSSASEAIVSPVGLTRTDIIAYGANRAMSVDEINGALAENSFQVLDNPIDFAFIQDVQKMREAAGAAATPTAGAGSSASGAPAVVAEVDPTRSPLYWVLRAREAQPQEYLEPTSIEHWDDDVVRTLFEDAESSFFREVHGANLIHEVDCVVIQETAAPKDLELSETSPQRDRLRALSTLQAAFDLAKLCGVDDLENALGKHYIDNMSSGTNLKKFNSAVVDTLVDKGVKTKLKSIFGTDDLLEALKTLSMLSRTRFGIKPMVSLAQDGSWEVHKPIRTAFDDIRIKDGKFSTLLRHYRDELRADLSVLPTQVQEDTIEGPMRNAMHVIMGKGTDTTLELTKSGAVSNPFNGPSELYGHQPIDTLMLYNTRDGYGTMLLDLMKRSAIIPNKNLDLEKARSVNMEVLAKEKEIPYNHASVYGGRIGLLTKGEQFSSDEVHGVASSKLYVNLGLKARDAYSDKHSFGLFISHTEASVSTLEKAISYAKRGDNQTKQTHSAAVAWRVMDINSKSEKRDQIQSSLGWLTKMVTGEQPNYAHWKQALDVFLAYGVGSREDIQCKSGKDRTGYLFFMVQVLVHLSQNGHLDALYTRSPEKDDAVTQAFQAARRSVIVSFAAGYLGSPGCYGAMPGSEGKKAVDKDGLDYAADPLVKKYMQAGGHFSEYAEKHRKGKIPISSEVKKKLSGYSSDYTSGSDTSGSAPSTPRQVSSETAADGSPYEASRGVFGAHNPAIVIGLEAAAALGRGKSKDGKDVDGKPIEPG